MTKRRKPSTKAEAREAARMLAAILDRTKDGTLSVDGPKAAGIVTRMEGAAVALKAISDRPKK